ncbi:vWA domain-containing protein [Georgenia faecalis]|uniref:VWA domain-containing protein n=1 Tax=Georgenia faecalis TaxID=2483799 RepID=A0ABV9D7C0_9MICO|nr:VWA domain-containing protein [Georgenia faecalis]
MILRLAWPLWAIVAVLGALLVLSVVLALRTRGATWWRRAGMVVCLAVIALAPAVPASTTTVRSNAELYFVVDRTGSMAAEDYDDGRPRLDGVRNDITALVDAMPGARYSVIAFDSQATRQLPLTTDSRAVDTWADTLVQEITVYSAGSLIDRPLEALTTTLEGAAERNPENVRIVFFLSDGENTDGDAASEDAELASFAGLAPLVDGGAVLGYGTAEGGQMRTYDGTPQTGPGTDAPWILDESQPGSPPALSRIDETSLRRVAEQLEVDYVHRTAPTDVSSLVAGLDVEDIAADGRRDVTVYADVWWPAAIVLALLLVWEAFALVRAVPRNEPPVRDAVPPAAGPPAPSVPVPDGVPAAPVPGGAPPVAAVAPPTPLTRAGR